MFLKPLFFILIFCGMSFAELVNVNPDPDGEPWIAGGFAAPEDFDPKKLNYVDPGNLPKIELPSRVDNSQNKFFRPVFNQVGGSCSQAAGIGYAYTYELNRIRDLSSDTPQTQYPTHFTYNFLNNGSGAVGSWWRDGWDIVESVGVMNVEEYGGNFATGGNSRWISGIEEWKSGHANRIRDYEAIEIGTPEGLEVLKHWFHNGLDGSDNGGIAVFAAGATGYKLEKIPEGSPGAGKGIITKWGPDVNHAMTFVGYDDSIRFDINGDGKFTNDIDINGDGIVDMRDWEIGALIVANSWGTSWGDGGLTYMMYSLLAEPYWEGGIFFHFADIVRPVEHTEPRFTAEVKMLHEQRNVYKILVGGSPDVNSESPHIFREFPFMRYQGGPFYPQGTKIEKNKYIEFSLDVDDILSFINTDDPFKFFFAIDENDADDLFDGEIISVTVVDNLNGTRYYSDHGSVPIVNNGRTIVPVVADENIFRPSFVHSYAGDGIVELEWTNGSKSTSFDSYAIYRNGELLASGLQTTSYTDVDISNGTLYTYRIAASFSGTYQGEILSHSVQVMPEEPSSLVPYFTDFEDGIDGWTIKGDLSGWILGDKSGGSAYCSFSGNDTQFILANPDRAGHSVTVNDHAASPVLNISFFKDVEIEFDYINPRNSSLYICDLSVMYRLGPDMEWILIEKLEPTQSWINKKISVPEEALLSNHTQLGFFVDDNSTWAMGGAGVDNVSITGTLATKPPQITASYPAQETVSISSLDPVQFSVDVVDEDTGPSELIYKWYIDDTLVREGGSSLAKVFTDPGSFEVTVTVSDKFDEVSRTWTITQTSIEDNIPLTTKLHQNYPNPFNPVTVIRFDNATEAFTVLNIYNSNGQLVRELVNRRLEPGVHSIVWDGKDNSGSFVSSGLYYYTVKAGNYTDTRKMMLFK